MRRGIFNADADSRRRQILTLKVFNEYVREVIEDSEYEVAFPTKTAQFILKVTLNSEFPNEKPVLMISPNITHPWVNENGLITSAPGLLNFTPHSDLGRVVQAIIREIQKSNPPVIDNNTRSASIPILDGKKRSSTYNFSPPMHNNSGTMQQPLHSQIFPDLNILSTDELRFLNECEDRQNEFIGDLSNVRDQNRILDELVTQVEEVAEENLSKQEQLLQLRSVVDGQIEEVAKLAFDNERLYNLYQELSDKYSPRNIQEGLGQAAKKADEASDKIADEFLQRNLDVDKFLSMFIKTKSLYQLRKTKEEKLGQQLDSLERAGF